MAVLAYFGILLLIPLFAARQDSFVRYHVNQGIILVVLEALMQLISRTIGTVPGTVGTIVNLVVGAVSLLLLIFAIIGIVHAAKGQEKPLPLLGGIAFLKF